jgi:hypothetical protein
LPDNGQILLGNVKSSVDGCASDDAVLIEPNFSSGQMKAILWLRGGRKIDHGVRIGDGNDSFLILVAYLQLEEVHYVTRGCYPEIA